MKEKNRIVVMGDVMIDHYIYGKCDRISPEAPVPVVNQTREVNTLGGAGNVMENLRAFGLSPVLFSICGDDDGARQLEMLLENPSSAQYFLAKDKNRLTTVKTRVLAGNHQMLRIDRESVEEAPEAQNQLLVAHLKKVLDETAILIMSDYCKGLFSTNLAREVIALCKQHGITTLLDSKQKDLARFHGVDIIKPNRREASTMSGIEINDHHSLEAACKVITEKTACQAVIVTLSEEGLAIYHEQQLQILPTKALEVFDVTGAGDTVIAAIAYGLSVGMPLTEACSLANHAAAVVVAKAGSATATLNEIENMKKRWL